MALGPGKYDGLCTYVRKAAGADAAIVIVIKGHRGNGFSCQGDLATLRVLPDLLEQIARDLRADGGASAGENRTKPGTESV